jgi:peptidoglycan/LPS O-acetylase OafA/YrhL
MLTSRTAGGRVFHPGLEGLRGVAVAAVLLFHDGCSWMQGGFLGVSTFFTLSGFLITGLLVTEFERTGRINLPNFWSRRFRRLMPGALLTLGAIALLGPLFVDVVQQSRLGAEGISAVFYLANWWLIFSDAGYASLMGSPSPMQHFWSLAIEEQYYLFYPVIVGCLLGVMSLGRRGLAAVLMLAMLSSSLWMAWLAGTDASTTRIYYGTDTRCAELLAGGLLALVLAGREPLTAGPIRSLVSILGMVGMAVSVYFWGASSVESPSLYVGGLAGYTACTVAIIAAAVLPDGPIRVVFSLSWVRRLSLSLAPFSVADRRAHRVERAGSVVRTRRCDSGRCWGFLPLARGTDSRSPEGLGLARLGYSAAGSGVGLCGFCHGERLAR